MAERTKATVLKTVDGATHPWVRIPLLPLGNTPADLVPVRSACLTSIRLSAGRPPSRILGRAGRSTPCRASRSGSNCPRQAASRRTDVIRAAHPASSGAPSVRRRSRDADARRALERARCVAAPRVRSPAGSANARPAARGLRRGRPRADRGPRAPKRIRAGYSMFSCAESSSINPRRCGTTAMSDHPSEWSPGDSTLPVSGVSQPAAMLSSVVLPDPERPYQPHDLSGARFQIHGAKGVHRLVAPAVGLAHPSQAHDGLGFEQPRRGSSLRPPEFRRGPRDREASLVGSRHPFHDDGYVMSYLLVPVGLAPGRGAQPDRAPRQY